MTISQIANLMSIPIATICLFISLRAFYIYNLSRSDMIYVLGVSMAFISAGTFVGSIGDAHVAGNNLNTDWGRTFGSCAGALFIFLSSLMKSHKQMQQLKQWQVVAAVLFVIVVLLTPFYPPTKSPPIALSLNACRMIIYTCAFVRYFALYLEKNTQFSLMLSIAFLIIVIGYALNMPGIIQPDLALFTIIAASVRITAYLTMLAAYSLG